MLKWTRRHRKGDNTAEDHEKGRGDQKKTETAKDQLSSPEPVDVCDVDSGTEDQSDLHPNVDTASPPRRKSERTYIEKETKLTFDVKDNNNTTPSFNFDSTSPSSHTLSSSALSSSVTSVSAATVVTEPHRTANAQPSAKRYSQAQRLPETESVSTSSIALPKQSNSQRSSDTSALTESSSSSKLNQTKMASALPDVTRAVPDIERESLGPEVEWEKEDLTIAQIAEMDNFPCICCYEEKVQEKDGHRDFLNAGLKIYSRQPVLMHMHVKKKQARARTIFKNPQGAYYEVGQTLIIPDDYKGWFELVPSDFSRATCYLSIADIAKVMPRKFFTRSNIRGIRVEGEGDEQKYLERKVPAGSVLETKGTFTAKWKTVAETGLLKKKTTEYQTQEVTYLKCLDHDQTELLVPLTHRGKFNAIYERGQLTQNAVYSMKDILSDLSLPIKVRLLFGKAPVVPCIFTGMLVVRSAGIDSAIVGSTILNKRNVLFEIPVKAAATAKYRLSDEPFQEMSTYKDAQKLCKKYADMFSTMIKLSSELDTDQKVIQHVPSDPSVMRQADEALRALDLITDISLTGEVKDHLLDSETSSMDSAENTVVPKGGMLEELTEYKSRESHTHV